MLFAPLVALSFAVPLNPTTPALTLGAVAPAMINGSPLWGPMYPEVVRVRSLKTRCTAVIVGPRAILTAAHCVKATDGSFMHRGERYEVKLVASPHYQGERHDLALGVTDRPIAGATYATLGSGVRAGDAIDMVGYGCTEPGGGGKKGELRLGTSRVVAFAKTFFMVARAPGGGAVCYGDSGGPVFVRKNGARRLVGIIARGDIEDTSYVISLEAARSRGFLKRTADRLGAELCGFNLLCPDSAPPVLEAGIDPPLEPIVTAPLPPPGSAEVSAGQ